MPKVDFKKYPKEYRGENTSMTIWQRARDALNAAMKDLGATSFSETIILLCKEHFKDDERFDPGPINQKRGEPFRSIGVSETNRARLIKLLHKKEQRSINDTIGLLLDKYEKEAAADQPPA
jgi:predicted CopG family antitoxin